MTPKIFLQSGKLMLGEFPEVINITHMSLVDAYNSVVSVAKASAVEVVNFDELLFSTNRDPLNTGEGILNDLPDGWTAEYSTQFKTSKSHQATGGQEWYDFPDQQNYEFYKKESETRKIARLIPSKASGIAAIGVPESGDFDAEPQWMVKENDIPVVHAQLDRILGKKSDSPVIPEGSEKEKLDQIKCQYAVENDCGSWYDLNVYSRAQAVDIVAKRYADWIVSKPAIDDTLKGSESGWISTKDRIPDHHNLVNICMTSGAITVGRMARTNRWSIFTVTGTDIESQTNRVEYWQSLPKSPKP